ncbi:MAG: hypothetical protein M9939_05235 [Mesorhizobium sp.]|nr:hypothetical protein [Mesorhizobium sp.]MCO5160516.1 hypothetical protein [Mesorhizobium sp.]
MEDWTYSYNNLDWLLSATNAGNAALSETYTYSATGNLLTRTRLSGAFTYPGTQAARPHAPLTLSARSFRPGSRCLRQLPGVRPPSVMPPA